MPRPRQITIETPEPLLVCLTGTLGLKRKDAKNLLKFGAVSVGGVIIKQFDHPLVAGDVLVVSSAQKAAAEGRLDFAQIQIVFEDDALVVLEKPAGLLTVGTNDDKTDTLFFRLNEYLRTHDANNPERALVVHRLDRETSGLVLFAKSEDVQRRLQESWEKVEKVYWAIVDGQPDPKEGSIVGYLTETSALQVFHNDHRTPGGRLAKTHYKLLQTRGDFSLVEVRLETGRKHQIRVHMAGLGCLVAGDRRYGSKVDPCGRLGLHACTLAFNHPLTGEPLRFHSPLPAALARVFPSRAEAFAKRPI